MGDRYVARDQFMQELLALRGSHVELSKTNEKLQRENERLQELMQALPDSIIAKYLDGRITYVSPLASEVHDAKSERRGSNEKLGNALNNKNQFYQLVGQSKQMREIYDLIDRIAGSTAKVLIQGETGTGKSLVARSIYQSSPRSEKQFVEVNCAVVQEQLLESDMFGHVRGAFTGAISDKKGKFEVADGGTIFLDDIDTLSVGLQAKLLRVLQDGQFERLGSTKTIQVDVRVIAASNQDLSKLMNERLFRDDLFFRLSVIPMTIPPLRERPEDIMLLASHFLGKYSALHNKELEGFTDGAIRMLEEHPWPGNVRELENAIERAVILEGSSFINTQSLMISQEHKKPESDLPNSNNNRPLENEKERVEREKIIETLIKYNWHRQKTADALGINRVTLYNKMKRLGIKEEEENIH
jgi:transcriptional regulator with PAS, ATPase and Fis domain